MVANLSRSAQFVELDLSRFDGQAGRAVRSHPLPRIGQLPYFITLGPYGYFWFRLQPDEREEELAASPCRRSRARVVGRGARRAHEGGAGAHAPGS